MDYTDNMQREIQALFSEGIAYDNIITQNKNNNKIKITDIAISKIPFVKFPDIPLEESNKLFDLERLLLSISKNENNNEVAITYKLYKELNETEEDRIAIVKGDEHEVDLGADSKTFHLLQSDRLAVINMHNHPNCSNFSLYDISFFLRNDSIKLLILLSNKGELNYILKNKRYNRIENVALFVESFKKICPNAVKGYSIDLEKLSEKDMIKATNMWIKESQKYGIKYEHVLNTEREDYYGKKENNTERTTEIRDEDEWER